MAHTIVISNEKGGTGKSTISMHLAIKLMQEGFNVAVVDMDGRQGTLSYYIINREKFCKDNNICLPTPKLVTYLPTHETEKHLEDIRTELNTLKAHFDAVIIDTPGAKNYLFEEAHLQADTLITPISDSLLDLNVISEINPGKPGYKHAGHYSQFVWEVKKKLAQNNKILNWIVVGNKVSPLHSKNKTQVFEYLNSAAKIYGFRVAENIKDRVIYKELFLQGLTVFDIKHDILKYRLSTSHIAAKAEISDLAEFICP